jgi:phenylacetate-coenzyme A ligase PaaK-like adenylate-forming protein
MTLAYQRKRLADFAAGARLSRELAERERWPRERLARCQQERLDELVGHATQGSVFYRERIGRPVGPVELGRLPTLDKATMMDRFDEIVTDPQLRRDELLAHVEALTGDALHLGRYRAMTTSGSSGRKGLFVYDRPAWGALIAQFLRYNAMVGIRPRLPRRLRVAALGGASASHMSRRVTQTVDIGLHRVLSLPVTLPMTQLKQELDRFQPQFINAYPSVAALLAEEQLAGRLRISPEAMSTTGELRTPTMTARIQEAFGVRPFDFYGTTEGLWGAECEHHTGIHLFEDMTIVENVDDDGRPVPDGQPGARLLLTSLYNRTQPLIRLELADAVTLEPDPCPCGRTLRRIRSIHGRSDDVLELPGAGATTIAVHPLQFAVVARDRDVVEFQVVQEGVRLRLLVVARGEAPTLETRLRAAVEQLLCDLGVAEPAVQVERRTALPRQPGGKRQMVVADRSARRAAEPAHPAPR